MIPFSGDEAHKPGGPADPRGGGYTERLLVWTVTKVARVLYPPPRASK